MTHDNTQSDVVEAWDRLTGCANACGFPSIEAAIEHLADIHLASLSTKDSDGLAEELFAIVKCTHHEDDALEFLTNNYDRILTALTSSDAVLEEVERHLTNAVKRLTVHEDEIGDADQLKINCDKALAHVECAIAAIRKGDNA